MPDPKAPAKARKTAAKRGRVTHPFKATTLFALPAIGAAIGVDADALRKWFADGEHGGGLMLTAELDEPAVSGGRPHRLHWRTAVALLLAVRLNALGFKLRGGEAAKVAGGVLATGFAFEHLFDPAGPLIGIAFIGHGIHVYLARRAAPAEALTDASGPDSQGRNGGLHATGALIFDPIAFGKILAAIAKESANV